MHVTASASARPPRDSARAPRGLRKLHCPQQWLQLIDAPFLPRVRTNHQRRRLCLFSIFSKWGAFQNCYDRKHQRYLKHILSQKETGTNTEIICFTVQTPARPQHIPCNNNNHMLASYMAFLIGHRFLIRLFVGRYAFAKEPSSIQARKERWNL